MIEFQGRLILLDIEGTVSPMAFVHEVMFPYARTRVAGWLQDHWGHEIISKLAHASGMAAFPQPEEATRAVLHLMDADAKETSLKQLQGYIWEEGFRTGELRSTLYEDVVPALERWCRQGIKVRIYSSGSIHAQQLFFAHTSEGDLRSYLSGYYDTTTGPKKDAASYTAIAADCGLDPSEILFISDLAAELNAAHSAGMRTALASRPGNLPQSPCMHDTLCTFDAITTP